MSSVRESLKVRTVRALSWSFAQEAALRALQFGISIFLTRILAPREFGLLAMLTVFITFAQALVDGGFGAALIQAKKPSQAHCCSIFYFNLFCSLVLAGVLWVAAPWIAGFYDQPLLTTMLRGLLLLPIINGLGLVQNTMLVRNLEFKKQTGILLASTILSGALAVVLASRGFGVWSLVAQQISFSVVRSGLLWVLSGWHPQWLFSLQALREMFKFASGMLASAVMGCLYDNLYPLLIGKFFSVASLGYFNRAQSVTLIASQSLGAISNRVTFPVFSTLQDDLVRFKKGLRQALITATFVQFPTIIGLAAIAKPLVLLLFTERWAPAVPYLQLLAFAGLLHPVHVLNLNVLLALGRSDIFFRMDLFKASLFLATSFITWRWGVMAMIWGQIFCNFVAYFVNSFYTKKLIGYSVWEQIRDTYFYLAASTAMGVLVGFIGAWFPPQNFLQLGLLIAFGSLVYLSICHRFKAKALRDLAGFVLRKEAVAA